MILGKKFVRNSLAAIAVGTMLLTGTAYAAEAATPYTASEGDTFWKLSKRFDIPLQKLITFNPKVDPKNIYAGLKLTLPASSSAAGVKAQLAVAARQSGAAKQGGQAAQAVKKLEAAREAAPAAMASKQSMQLQASAYTAAAEENGWGPVDYFGNALKVGTVAVDPKVIPLGTKLYITGYDYAGLPAGGFHAVATDTGSAVKGNRIDIFVADSRKEALKFGLQNVTVYVQ